MPVTFTVDQAVVDTSIVTGPAALATSKTAAFDFDSNKTGVTYECSLVGPDVIVRASAPGSARVNGSSAPRSSKRSSTSSAKAKRPAPPPPPPVVSAAS